MRKLALTAMAVCFAGLCATAFAASKADPPSPNPDKGLQDCYAPLWQETYPNPGFWFKGIEGHVGSSIDFQFNIHRWFEVIAAPVEDGGFGNPFDLANVGDMVNVGCDNI
jgi:hypothetical protein